MLLNSSLLEEVENYIRDCDSKIKYHTQNGINANGFNQVLSVFNTILSAGCSLSMVVLGSKDFDTLTVAITGGVFSFFITILQRVQNSYNFTLLSSNHFNASDNFLDVKNQFLSIKRHIHDDKFNENEYQHAIIRHQFINDKSHIPSVRTCYFCCCFK